jgi:tetratricopeptide (TPR) repeat protein
MSTLQPQMQKLAQLINAREFDAAEAICRAHLDAHENDFDALLMLASIDYQRGRHDACVEKVQRCLAIQPDNPRLHFNLAMVRGAQGQYDAALAAFDHADRAAPGQVPVLGAKADLAEKHGDYALVESTLGPLMLSGMEDANAGLVWGRMKHHSGAHEEAIAIARRHLAAPQMPIPTRRQLHFLVGNAHEKLGAYDEAFAAYTEGNGIGSAPFDPDEHGKRIDHLVAVCSRDRLGGLDSASVPSTQPVFVVGMPRCGSTLVEQIIHAHPEAVAVGESTAMLEVVRRVPDVLGTSDEHPDGLASMTTAAADELARIYLAWVGTIAGDAGRIVDKQLLNIDHLGLIQLILPEARVIDCRRDALDNCLSCYSAALDPAVFPYSTDLRALGRAYRQYERLMAHWDEALARPPLRVGYEALVAEPERVSREIIEFCDLPWDDRCLRYYEAERHVTTLSYEQVRRPIYTSSVKRHEHFAAHLGPLKDALAAG